MNPRQLRLAIVRLSSRSPETDRFSRAWRRRDAEHEQKQVWYRHQKEHWLGWLEEYDGPGYYGRADWKRSAEFIFNHIVNPQMLVWLAEALKVDRTVIRRAVRAALGEKRMAGMAGAIRREIPWRLIEGRLEAKGSARVRARS